MSCSLDRKRELSLMNCAGAGDSAGQDLGTLGKILSEAGNILIVNAGNLVRTEDANLFSSSVAHHRFVVPLLSCFACGCCIGSGRGSSLVNHLFVLLVIQNECLLFGF